MKQKTKASLPAYLKIAAILREQIFSGSIIHTGNHRHLELHKIIDVI